MATRTTETPLYVVARNGWGRPTLMHKLTDGTASITACGRQVDAWSRAYLHTPIEVILCKHSACRA